MQKKTIPCKGCGKPFVPCNSTMFGDSNWKAVGCTPACAVKYWGEITDSRDKDGVKVETVIAEVKPTAIDVEETPVVEEPAFETIKPRKKKYKGYKKYDENEVD